MVGWIDGMVSREAFYIACVVALVGWAAFLWELRDRPRPRRVIVLQAHRHGKTRRR